MGERRWRGGSRSIVRKKKKAEYLVAGEGYVALSSFVQKGFSCGC